MNVWDSFDRNPAVAVIDRVIERFFETDPPRFLEVPFGLHAVKDVRRLFHGAGYETVEVAHVAETVETTDHIFPARGFVTGNPTIIEVEQRATVSVEKILAAAVEELEREFGPAPTNLTFREIVYLAHKPSK